MICLGIHLGVHGFIWMAFPTGTQNNFYMFQQIVLLTITTFCGDSLCFVK